MYRVVYDVTVMNNMTMMNRTTMTNRVMGLGHRHSCHGKENDSQQ
jgi:hypothetical protein